MANTRRVWKSVRYSVSNGLDTAYWSFLEHGYVVSSLMDTAYCLQEVSDKSAANTLDNENTSSSSSIVVKEDEAPQIVSSSIEQVATEPNSLVLNENANELVQEDFVEFDGNVFYNPPQTLMFEEAESSLTFQDPSNMHEFYQKHHSSDRWTKNHPTEQVIVSTIKPKNINEDILDHSWIESMQDELNQFKRLDAWELVECPIGRNIIATQSCQNLYGICGSQELSNLPNGRQNGILNGPLKEEVFVRQPDGFVDPDFPNHVHQSPRGIFICQLQYTMDLLKKHGMEKYDTISTPIATTKIDADLQGTQVDQIKYRSMIGGLMYLTASRPDIAFVTFVCAHYQAHPTEKHLKEVKRIFQYLPQTINMGLWYSNDSGLDLIAYSDTEHAGCNDDCKSTFGGIQFLGDKLVSWSSKKQDRTTMSTAKVEYVSLSACCAQEHVEKGTIEIYFVGTKYQLADLFTKALPKESYALTTIVDVPTVYLQQFWRTVSKVPGPEDTIKFMVNTQEFIYTVDMFRDILHLPIETPENPFIAPVNIKIIKAVMNRVGYQGVVDKVSAFYTKNLAQPWQTMFKDFMNNVNQKKEAIQIEEDYHSIKDDIPLVSVYTTGNVLVRGMLIPYAFLTEEIHATDDFKEYETVFMNVDVTMNQPQLVISTKYNHLPGALRRMCRRQGYMIQNMERKCITTKQFWKTHKQVNQVLHEGVSQLAEKATGDLIENNLKPCIAATIIEDRDDFYSELPDLVSQEFNAEAPKIIEELFKNYVQSNVIQVHPTITTSTKTTSSADLQQQLYFNMKRSLQDQANDPALWEDDAPPEGEKRVKRHKTSKSSKSVRGSSSKHSTKDSTTYLSKKQQQKEWDAWVEETVIDEDEVILEDETPK
ncbi:hypothetical protein Tco_0429523 [Tanacetum coccineum]